MLLKKEIIATFCAVLAFLGTLSAEYLHLAPRIVGIADGLLVLFCGEFLGRRQALIYYFVLGLLDLLFLSIVAALKYLLLYMLLPLLITLWDKKLFSKILTLIFGSLGIYLYLIFYLKYFNFIYLFNLKINNFGYLAIIAVIAAIVYYFLLKYIWDYIKRNISENLRKYLLNILD